MDKEQIKQLLYDCGYADNYLTDETVKRLLSLTGRPSEMLKGWIENGDMPTFGPIKGIGSEFLSSKLKMKVPALIIAYAMIEIEPEENARYFKYLSENITGFYPQKTK